MGGMPGTGTASATPRARRRRRTVSARLHIGLVVVGGLGRRPVTRRGGQGGFGDQLGAGRGGGGLGVAGDPADRYGERCVSTPWKGRRPRRPGLVNGRASGANTARRVDRDAGVVREAHC